jgi:hypothetical protein
MEGKSRRGHARQGKAWLDNARQSVARQGKAHLVKARRG